MTQEDNKPYITVMPYVGFTERYYPAKMEYDRTAEGYAVSAALTKYKTYNEAKQAAQKWAEALKLEVR